MEITNRDGMKEIYTRFIRRNGKIIYPKNARFFHFWAPVDKHEARHQQLSLFDMDEE